METKKELAALNALRSRVANVTTEAGTFNQARKALMGLEKKCADALTALNLSDFNLSSIKAAWADELKIEGRLALYINVTEQISVGTNDKGEPIMKNCYEKTENKKGDVKYKVLKRRFIVEPEAWSAPLIIEGLVQSHELTLAKLEAEVANMHVNNALRKGVYIKEVAQHADGSSTTDRKSVV